MVLLAFRVPRQTQTARGGIPTDELVAVMQRGYVAAFRWLGNAEESRDACQEAAERALQAQDRFDASRPLYPWFYRILKNLCMTRLERRRRSQASREELSAQAEWCPAPDAETIAIDHERAQAVVRAIDRLPPELAEMIELRHFQDLSYDEMAQVLDIPTGTVMSRLYRARRRLRELVAADGGLGGGPERRTR